MMYAFCFQLPFWMPYSQLVAGLHPCSPLEDTHSRHMCILVMVIGQCKEWTEWLLPTLLWIGGSIILVNQLSFSHSNNMFGHTALDAWQRVTQSPSLPHMVERHLFPSLGPSTDRINCESMMDIKPGDSCVVIGYQVDEFTCTWSAELCGFMGKVSSLTHFHLGLGWEDYSFLHGEEGSSFPGLAPPMTCDSESVVAWILVILVWWLDIRLMGLLTPGLQDSAAFSHLYPWFMGKVSSLNHFSWTRVWALFISRPRSCRLWTGLGLISTRCQNWTHYLMRLMLLFLQSPQVFSIWLVLFLILLNHS